MKNKFLLFSVLFGLSLSAQASRDAGMPEMKQIFAEATPLSFSEIQHGLKSGICKSIINGQLVAGPSAFVATRNLEGVRFGDYQHSAFPDVLDTGDDAIYEKIISQGTEIAYTYGETIHRDHAATLRMISDRKPMSRMMTLDLLLTRWVKTDFGSYYPLQHPSLSSGKAVAYPVSAGTGGMGTFVGRTEFRRTQDGLMISGAQPAVEVDLSSKAKDLDANFKNAEPTLYCFWYEDVSSAE